MLLQINTAAFAFVAESLNRVITNQMLKHSVYVTQIEFDLSPQEQVAQYEWKFPIGVKILSSAW